MEMILKLPESSGAISPSAKRNKYSRATKVVAFLLATAGTLASAACSNKGEQPQVPFDPNDYIPPTATAPLSPAPVEGGHGGGMPNTSPTLQPTPNSTTDMPVFNGVPDPEVDSASLHCAGVQHKPGTRAYVAELQLMRGAHVDKGNVWTVVTGPLGSFNTEGLKNIGTARGVGAIATLPTTSEYNPNNVAVSVYDFTGMAPVPQTPQQLLDAIPSFPENRMTLCE